MKSVLKWRLFGTMDDIKISFQGLFCEVKTPLSRIPELGEEHFKEGQRPIICTSNIKNKKK